MNIQSINWQICSNNEWCRLNDLDLDTMNLQNLPCVYVIWYLNDKGQRVHVKVGQTDNIKSRLSDHRIEFQQDYSNVTLCVTWAKVSQNDQDGIESYLGNLLKPEDRYPDVPQIVVSLPPWN